MSENWQAGDLALCVKSAGTLHGAASGELQGGPIMGCIYPVRDVKDFPEYHHLETTIGLKIDGFIGWVSAVYFRKLDQHTPKRPVPHAAPMRSRTRVSSDICWPLRDAQGRTWAERRISNEGSRGAQ